MGSRGGAPQAFHSQEHGGGGGGSGGGSGGAASSSSSSSTAAGRCTLALACCCMVVSLAALAVILAKERQPPPPPPPPPSPPASEPTRPEARNFSSQLREPPNFAQLIFNPNGSTLIKERTLDWFSGTSTKGGYLGSAFKYKNRELLVKVPGRYCIFAQMRVRRYDKYSKKKVNVILTVHCKSVVSPEPRQLLSVQLELSPKSNGTVQAFNVISHPLASNDMLYVNVTAETNVEQDWRLTESGSLFGLFQIVDS